MVATHTHVITELANPYLRCDTCEKKVTGFVAFEGQAEGCFHQGELIPCSHIGMTSICPSWSPVDGCRCEEHLGYRYHAVEQKPKLVLEIKTDEFARLGLENAAVRSEWLFSKGFSKKHTIVSTIIPGGFYEPDRIVFSQRAHNI